MSNETQLAERKPTSLREHLIVAQPEFAKTLPQYISPERFVRTAQSALAHTRGIENVKTPKNVASLLSSCMKAAADGLILDGREAALVVDRDGNVQYRPMMRGLLKLAHNSGMIKSLVVEVARDADEFEYEPTRSEQPITHKINVREKRGDCFAVYAICVLMTGGLVHDVMTVEDVNRIRDRSDAYRAFKAGKIKSTPWSTDWSEMARKTVFRRLSKYLPSSTDRNAAILHQAAERIDEDYNFEVDHDPAGDDGSTPKQPAGKKRGGAAAVLKDVTPAKGRGRQQRQQQTPAHDPDTGEITDDQDEGVEDQGYDTGEGRGPNDDI